MPPPLTGRTRESHGGVRQALSEPPEVVIAVFIVRIEHAREDLWRQWIAPHVEWLNRLVGEGTILASGPTRGTAIRMGVIVLEAADADAAMAVIETDPFWQHGVVTGHELIGWDPVFGALAAASSHPEGMTADDLVG